MSTTRLVSVQSGRPIVSERWGINLGAVDVLFWLACMTARTGTNPLNLLDGIAETWRQIDAELALEAIE